MATASWVSLLTLLGLCTIVPFAFGCAAELLLGCRPRRRLESPWLNLGVPIRLANVTVIPLYGRREAGSCDRIASWARARRVRVAEREAGDPQRADGAPIVVSNKGSRAVLLPAGLILRGGAQDRQLGEELLIEPGEQRVVSAYCVERCRSEVPWYGSSRFTSTSMLAPVPTRTAALQRRDQEAVWSSIEWFNDRLECNPLTGTLLASFDSRRLTRGRSEVQRRLLAKLRRVPGRARIVGFAYVYPGSEVGARFFASHRLYRKFEAELVTTLANDEALAEASPSRAPSERVDLGQVRAFLKDALAELATPMPDTPAEGSVRVRANGRVRSVFTADHKLVSVHCDPGPARLAS